MSAAKLAPMLGQYPTAFYKPGERKAAYAQQALLDECGLAHAVVREWIAPLKGTMPGTGVPLEIDEAIFAEYAGRSPHALPQVSELLPASLLVLRLTPSQGRWDERRG